MPRTLTILGLALVALAILLKLVSAILQIAIPAGVLLVVIGLIWHLLERGGKRKGQ